MSVRLFSSDACFIQRRFESGYEFFRRGESPKMQKEKTRRFEKHVVVQRRHLNAIFGERFDHRIDSLAIKTKSQLVIPPKRPKGA
jgi:hypothetical protein